MKAELLERAVKEDVTQVLKPVLDASYALTPVTSMEATQIALDTNKKLGYDLFEDPYYYPTLIREFSMVAQAVQNNALDNK